MKLERVKLEGVCLLVPTIYEDSRGYFFESFNQKRFNELAGLDLAFVQDNQSKSQKNVVRGLHMQAGVHAQDKLVRVIQGSIWDVVVDLRPDSKTYGEWYGVELSERNKRQLYIPKGFAHGFRTLEEGTTIVYKCSEYYHPESELTLKWNDSRIGIDWGIKEPILSNKDKEGLSLEELEKKMNDYNTRI